MANTQDLTIIAKDLSVMFKNIANKEMYKTLTPAQQKLIDSYTDNYIDAKYCLANLEKMQPDDIKAEFDPLFSSPEWAGISDKLFGQSQQGADLPLVVDKFAAAATEKAAIALNSQPQQNAALTSQKPDVQINEVPVSVKAPRKLTAKEQIKVLTDGHNNDGKVFELYGLKPTEGKEYALNDKASESVVKAIEAAAKAEAKLGILRSKKGSMRKDINAALEDAALKEVEVRALLKTAIAQNMVKEVDAISQDEAKELGEVFLAETPAFEKNRTPEDLAGQAAAFNRLYSAAKAKGLGSKAIDKELKYGGEISYLREKPAKELKEIGEQLKKDGITDEVMDKLAFTFKSCTHGYTPNMAANSKGRNKTASLE